MMIIEKTINLDHTVDVDIDADDILGVLQELSEANILRFLNQIAGMLSAIDEDVVAEMTDGQRQTVSSFFINQSAKYSPNPVAALAVIRRGISELEKELNE